MNPLAMWGVISTLYFGISDGKSVGRKKRVGFGFLCSCLFLGYHEMSAEFSQIPSLKCLLVSVGGEFLFVSGWCTNILIYI